MYLKYYKFQEPGKKLLFAIGTIENIISHLFHGKLCGFFNSIRYTLILFLYMIVQQLYAYEFIIEITIFSVFINVLGSYVFLHFELSFY